MTLTHGSQQLKKGSAELLILSLVEDTERHGYDIARLIERESDGTVTFHAASLYPLLYRLEKRDWISGRWVVPSKGSGAQLRRRRMYRITAKGRSVLAAQRSRWRAFARAVNRIAGIGNA